MCRSWPHHLKEGPIFKSFLSLSLVRNSVYPAEWSWSRQALCTLLLVSSDNHTILLSVLWELSSAIKQHLWWGEVFISCNISILRLPNIAFFWFLKTELPQRVVSTGKLRLWSKFPLKVLTTGEILYVYQSYHFHPHSLFLSLQVWEKIDEWAKGEVPRTLPTISPFSFP